MKVDFDLCKTQVNGLVKKKKKKIFALNNYE